MAEIHKLDGSVLDAAKPGRNERIAEILAKLAEDNDAGKVAALAVITLDNAQMYDAFWAYPEDVNKYPWLFIVVGAIETLKASMIAGTPNRPDEGASA